MIEDDAKKALLKLFQCYNVTGSDAEKKIKFAAYWDVLSSLPMAITVSVCAKASRGEICNHGFMPAAAELYQAAVTQLPRRIDKPPALDKPNNEDERERVRALIDTLANDMKMWVPLKDYEAPPVDVEAYLHAKYRDKPLPQLSPELRKQLGACIPRIEE